MASWVSHLIVADAVLKQIPDLVRHEFCVGCIAPDCNVENADWTAFDPPRSVTHWMGGERKSAADCERFIHEYVKKRWPCPPEEESFLWGYYAHLVTDAEYQRMIRDEKQVNASWERVLAHPELRNMAQGLPRDFDSIKRLIGKQDRMMDIDALEHAYLKSHPDSGYLTEIMGLEAFPDYLDYLPRGAVARKVKVMGVLPGDRPGKYPYVCLSKEEYAAYLKRSAQLAAEGILRYRDQLRR